MSDFEFREYASLVAYKPFLCECFSHLNQLARSGPHKVDTLKGASERSEDIDKSESGKHLNKMPTQSKRFFGQKRPKRLWPGTDQALAGRNAKPFSFLTPATDLWSQAHKL
jgi:hypothetical protein